MSIRRNGSPLEYPRAVGYRLEYRCDGEVVSLSFEARTVWSALAKVAEHLCIKSGMTHHTFRSAGGVALYRGGEQIYPSVGAAAAVSFARRQARVRSAPRSPIVLERTLQELLAGA